MVWRAAVKAEVIVAEDQAAGVILWDMSSFFQIIRHRRLMRRARDTEFPMVIARMAVALYRSERRLCMGKSLGRVGVKPNRGVAPGCTFAIYSTLGERIC